MGTKLSRPHPLPFLWRGCGYGRMTLSELALCLCVTHGWLTLGVLVCHSVCYHVFCQRTTRWEKSNTNGFSATQVRFYKWRFSKSTVFKSYGSDKANMLMSTASPWLVFATLHTVEASEVTQRSGCKSFKCYLWIELSSGSEKLSTVSSWLWHVFIYSSRMCV